MYHSDNGQRSYKPQTKHAERTILPRSSQKYLRTYLCVRGSRKTEELRSPQDADAWAVCPQMMFQGGLWEVLAILQVWISFA